MKEQQIKYLKAQITNCWFLQDGTIPLRLYMWGKNLFTGGHFDAYVVDYYDYKPGPPADEVFSVPDYCPTNISPDLSPNQQESHWISRVRAALPSQHFGKKSNPSHQNLDILKILPKLPKAWLTWKALLILVIRILTMKVHPYVKAPTCNTLWPYNILPHDKCFFQISSQIVLGHGRSSEWQKSHFVRMMKLWSPASRFWVFYRSRLPSRYLQKALGVIPMAQCVSCCMCLASLRVQNIIILALG